MDKCTLDNRQLAEAVCLDRLSVGHMSMVILPREIDFLCEVFDGTRKGLSSHVETCATQLKTCCGWGKEELLHFVSKSGFKVDKHEITLLLHVRPLYHC